LLHDRLEVLVVLVVIFVEPVVIVGRFAVGVKTAVRSCVRIRRAPSSPLRNSTSCGRGLTGAAIGRN
jgi:hypothetical protein